MLVRRRGRVAYHFLQTREFLGRGDIDRLDEELVAALRILRGVGLHGLEEYCMPGREVSRPVACDYRKSGRV